MDTGERARAADLFVQLLVEGAYQVAVDSVMAVLHSGPAGGKPYPIDVDLHRWFERLDDGQRLLVRALVEDAAHAAVFECCCLLDGVVGYPIPGQPSDLALYLNVYVSDHDVDAERPNQSIRVNKHDPADLHELLNEILLPRLKGPG